jgi:diacylglycerol O-acyltransferase/trehalose O-mycolyltransferase
VARGWALLCRLSAPVRVAWLAMLAVIVVLGGVACGGGTQAGSGTWSPGRVGQLRIVATAVLSARMRDLAIASPALGGTVKVRLLLPVHYSARPEGRWPVLYLLHGCCDTYQSWTRSTDVEALTAHSDVLVVMPDGGKAGFTPTG